jgi:hypothetical protein
MIAVVAPAGAYRTAVAELPLSSRLGDRASGAVVVVPGDTGWVDAVRAAEEAGARAVVVADPEQMPVDEVRLLAQRTRMPVILERPLLRADATADAQSARAAQAGTAPPRAVVLDGAASAGRLSVIARDAVGWGRVLAGQAPTLVSGHRGLALLETGGGAALTLSVVATRRPGRGWVRAQALGEVLTDVEVEGRASSIAVATAAGRFVLPARYESSERLALRRAVAAAEANDQPSDLADLIADTEPVEAILHTRA